MPTRPSRPERWGRSWSTSPRPDRDSSHPKTSKVDRVGAQTRPHAKSARLSGKPDKGTHVCQSPASARTARRRNRLPAGLNATVRTYASARGASSDQTTNRRKCGLFQSLQLTSALAGQRTWGNAPPRRSDGENHRARPKGGQRSPGAARRSPSTPKTGCPATGSATALTYQRDSCVHQSAVSTRNAVGSYAIGFEFRPGATSCRVHRRLTKEPASRLPKRARVLRLAN